MATTKRSGLRFVGQPGQFHPGIPARNLTPEEAEKYADRLKGSPLYEQSQDEE